MANPGTFLDSGPSGADRLITGRLLRLDLGSYDMVPASQADVLTITRWIVSGSDGVTVNSEDPLLVSATILPSVSHGDVWKTDAQGFNFKDTVPGLKLNDPSGSVEIQYKVIMADGVIVKPPPVQVALRPSE